MTTNMNDLWVTASSDAEGELQESLVLEARLEASEYWPMLASAESPADFNNRLALIDDQISSIARKVTEGQEGEYAYPVVRGRLVNALAQDFKIVHEARKQKESARIARNQAHATKLQREVLAELSREASDGTEWTLAKDLKPGDRFKFGEDDRVAVVDKFIPNGSAFDKGSPVDPDVPHDSLGRSEDLLKAHFEEGGQSGFELFGPNGGVHKLVGTRKHADGPTTADPNFLAAPAEGQGTPTSTEGTPGSNAGNTSSADGEDLDESKGPNVIDDSVVVNGKRVARFQTKADVNLERRHFNHIAEGIRTAPVDEATREILANHFADHLAGTNPNFNRDRFVGASTKTAHTGSRHFLAHEPVFDRSDAVGGTDTLADYPGTRVARIPGGSTSIEQVKTYMPSNYNAVEDGDGSIWISGHDHAGWTLDGYVIPRLASGLIFATEIPESEAAHTSNRKTAFGDPIGYTYEADVHCPSCAEKRWGRGADGFIGSDSTDSEGNPVGAIAPWDEGTPFGEYCGDCGAEISPPNGIEE